MGPVGKVHKSLLKHTKNPDVSLLFSLAYSKMKRDESPAWFLSFLKTQEFDSIKKEKLGCPKRVSVLDSVIEIIPAEADMKAVLETLWEIKFCMKDKRKRWKTEGKCSDNSLSGVSPQR